MDTEQINNILKEDAVARNSYLGTFSWNMIPNMPHGASCVVNTDCSLKPGQHWVAYAHMNNDLEFFDSYGNHPRFFTTVPRLIDKFNPSRLQGYDSSVCGQWCIYFLLHRLRGHTMDDIVKRFGSDHHVNDHFVYEFVRELSGVETGVHSINSLLTD